MPVEVPTSYNPAISTDLPWVSNGTYTIVDALLSEPLVINIHTVRSGALQGKRIIRMASTELGREWSGFGSLQADGTVWIWRSHQHLRGTAVHRVLNREIFRMAAQREIRMWSQYSIESSNGGAVSLRNPVCNHCGVTVATLAAYCDTHVTQLNVVQSEIPWRQRGHNGSTHTVPAAWLPRQTINGRSSFRTATPRRTARPTAPRTPLMSEIDPTQIR